LGLSGFFFFSQLFLLFNEFVSFFFFGVLEHFGGSFENVLLGFGLFVFDEHFSLGFFSLGFGHQHFFEADFFFLEDFGLFSQFSLLFFGFKFGLHGNLLGFCDDGFQIFDGVFEFSFFGFVLFFQFLVDGLFFSVFSSAFGFGFLGFFNKLFIFLVKDFSQSKVFGGGDNFKFTVVKIDDGLGPFFHFFAGGGTEGGFSALVETLNSEGFISFIAVGGTRGFAELETVILIEVSNEGGEA
jgi:hypothetical protein